MNYNPHMGRHADVQALAFLWPFVAVFLFTGTLQTLFAAICLVLVVSTGWMALRMEITPLVAFCIPFIVGIFLFTIARAGIIFYIRGGIKWRDTFYTKEQLRNGRL